MSTLFVDGFDAVKEITDEFTKKNQAYVGVLDDSDINLKNETPEQVASFEKHFGVSGEVTTELIKESQPVFYGVDTAAPNSDMTMTGKFPEAGLMLTKEASDKAIDSFKALSKSLSLVKVQTAELKDAMDLPKFPDGELVFDEAKLKELWADKFPVNEASGDDYAKAGTVLKSAGDLTIAAFCYKLRQNLQETLPTVNGKVGGVTVTRDKSVITVRAVWTSKIIVEWNYGSTLLQDEFGLNGVAADFLEHTLKYFMWNLDLEEG